MKKLILLALLAAATVTVSAQGVMPPGSSDKNLDDRSIKERSIELEKAKRDASKSEKNSRQQEQIEKLRFDEIKEDFEKIQTLQSGIVEAYTKGKQINYAVISGNSVEIEKRSERLEKNLFALPAEDSKNAKKVKDKKKEDAPTVEDKIEPVPTDVKNLIVQLDNAVLSFTQNPMFTNPQVVSAADNLKAKADLKKIMRLSSALRLAAEKTAAQ